MSFPVTDGVETVMSPPPGWVVNFAHPTHDDDTAREAFWIAGFELLIATGFLAQRLYTKLFIVHKFQIDDYLLVLAYIGVIGVQAILLQAFRVGLLGTHAWELSVDGYNQSSQMILATTLTYIPTTILSKLVLCFFYYRLSPVLMYQYAVYFTAFICAGGLGAIWFSVLFACKPIAATWDVRLAAGSTCVNSPAIYIIQAALGCVTDLMLLLLPIPTVIGLHLSVRHKAGLVGMFAIGSVTLVTSVVRLVLLLPGLGNKDQPWVLAEGCLWVIVEANLLIICGSLPTLKIFLNQVAPRILRDRSKKESSGPVSSDNYNLRTFGQGSNAHRRKFDTLVELEHDQFDRSQFRPTETGQTDVIIHGGQADQADKASVNSRVKGDADSEEAILQIRTTTVAFSKR
ncbi:hypothetical protein GGR53DRAFT_511764 [Hypoxylon sp. FL1150]|nr:hypothetical protein GGR53DRAFT_511764 [Hypoxylon sp. FL1150]